MALIDELEQDIQAYIAASGSTLILRNIIESDQLLVLKYMSAHYLDDALTRMQLYASEKSGFTWGDAIYVAPVDYPRSTMMYGSVGVAGTYATSGKRFFNADNAKGVELYQRWITYQATPYRDLTTTVHANSANRTLRNDFRSRFQIDCVYFRPDEGCTDYVDMGNDLWLAVTHWDAYRNVGSGFSDAVGNLKWCVVAPDAFKADGRGYRSALYNKLTKTHGFVTGRHPTLVANVKAAYGSLANEVVLWDFR